MTNEEIIKEFEEITDKYKKHAGQWHDETCSFPEVDHAVCNCTLPANKKIIKAFLLQAISSSRASLLVELLAKMPTENDIMQKVGVNMKHREGMISMLSQIKQIIKETHE